MGTFSMGIANCLASAAILLNDAGRDEQIVSEFLNSGLRSSDLIMAHPFQAQMPQNTFSSPSVNRNILTTKRRRRSGARRSSTRCLQTSAHGHRFDGVCVESSQQLNPERSHGHGAQNVPERSPCVGDKNAATDRSFDDGERLAEAESRGTADDAGVVPQRDEEFSFRASRRLLLSSVAAVGISSAFSSPSRAIVGGRGSEFAPFKGSWFLGNSEADPSLGNVDQQQEGGKGDGKGAGKGEVEEQEEKKDSGSGEDSRVYDASVLGEPLAIGTDKGRVWTKLLASRVVYLGEAEKVADADDKLLELEIVRALRDKCFEQRRSISLAFEAFQCPMQPELNAYMSKKLTDEELRIGALHLSDDHWLEYLPILQYCRQNGVRLIACGTPLEVLRTVQANGVQALSTAERQKYIPPAQGGYRFRPSPMGNSGSLEGMPNSSGNFGPGPYRFAQSRVVEDYTMSRVVTQIVDDGGSAGLLLVITGSSHVRYGARGSGAPGWVAKKKDMQKRTQAVVLLNPERQHLRKEGDLPEADFLWYSASKVCERNCFDRAEVARVMGAAGIKRDALPQDLQVGIKQGLVPPEVLESFFELEQNPILAEFTRRFQGLRERWLADRRFLQRLAIEETISITTALIAQFQERGGRFWKELDYVATDTIRGAVVDFFTVWLPAPRLSFREIDPDETFNGLDSLKGLLGSFPDNAFQRPRGGEKWGIGERVGGILVGGLKLFVVGMVSSFGTSAGSDLLLAARKYFSSSKGAPAPETKRTPVLKTALVYASFLGASANLRYQIIAGVIEHWLADYWLVSQPLLGGALSFGARVANSYYGTGQWIELARFTGIQKVEDETQPSSKSDVEEGAEIDSKKTADVVSTSSLVVGDDMASGTEHIGNDNSKSMGSNNITGNGSVQDPLQEQSLNYLGSSDD